MPTATYKSSTQDVPSSQDVPAHIAIIMDGNGRWAKRRHLPRVAGHKRGVESVRHMVKACSSRGIEFLTLFAFSSENWRRPVEEVSFLMQLFRGALTREIEKLHDNRVRFKVVGDLTALDDKIRALIRKGEDLTSRNDGLTLTVAVNYGGRWDILQALTRLVQAQPDLIRSGLNEAAVSPYLSMAYAPEPDLFIRTGGEQRISNFLLWQLAYTELYFTDTLWPDFDAAALDDALTSFRRRERRFGRTSEQLARSLAIV